MSSFRNMTMACAVAATMTLSGCATMTANNKDMQLGRVSLQNGDLEGALRAVAKREDLCGILDRAVLYQNQGNAVASNAEFDRALAMIKQFEARAVVSGTEVGRGIGSVLLNDKTLEYQGEGFEKVLIHTLKAQNYLLLGDEEGARVEIRNANMRQDEERKKHQDVVQAGRADGGKYDDKVSGAFVSSAVALARMADAYQNPFATYLSGVVYELNGDTDDAFLDYKNAFKMVPNQLIGSELVRLATKLGRKDELEELGIAGASNPSKAGNTLVILENGLAPEKVELKIPIQINTTVVAAAVPVTQLIPTNLSEAVILDDNGQEVARTSTMVDIEGMAVRNLHDHYPAILARQAVRLAAKTAANMAAQKAANQGNAMAGLAVQLVTNVASVVTEQADLRAWYELPRSIHMARFDLPAGVKEVTLRFLDLGGMPIVDQRVPVTPAGKHLNLVGVRFINNRVLTWPSTGPAPAGVASATGAPASM